MRHQTGGPRRLLPSGAARRGHTQAGQDESQPLPCLPGWKPRDGADCAAGWQKGGHFLLLPWPGTTENWQETTDAQFPRNKRHGKCHAPQVPAAESQLLLWGSPAELVSHLLRGRWNLLSPGTGGNQHRSPVQPPFHEPWLLRSRFVSHAQGRALTLPGAPRSLPLVTPRPCSSPGRLRSL